MNLISMLYTNVKPLSDYTPPREKKPTHKRSTANANLTTHNAAVAKYRAVMGAEWLSTRKIENRLGMSRSSCLPNLLKWEKQGLVERRKPCAAIEWNRMKGYEWRFKE